MKQDTTESRVNSFTQNEKDSLSVRLWNELKTPITLGNNELQKGSRDKLPGTSHGYAWELR